ncbi:hypothetical protein VP1G_02137 [Cytospora mali]|uniref:FAD linked oxidase N-terminal domain-containing protein n=1 Tax=Cytospora mali TaxID=578113 RepID=A0A194USK6_CYTMA|nr:hypothetical protein VP1G_02137 [Valsa mali var. pyri (nom. inval.)]
MGAGFQSREAYEAAHQYDVTIVGGEGEFVGIAGGYIQGGGHSPMAGIYGLSSDQFVEVDVVTADGNFLTCSDDQNSDLLWGRDLGHREGLAKDGSMFWDAMYAFFKYFIPLADAGAYSYLRWYSLSTDIWYFSMTPFWTPNKTVDEHVTLLRPWLDDLAALNITLEINATYYDSFYDAWAEVFPLEEVGYDAGRIASRLFPRANWDNITLMNETWSAIKNTSENDFVFTAFNMKNELHPENTANSANPAWRDSIIHAISATCWEDGDPVSVMIEDSNSLTYGCMDQWRAVTPGSGAYLGEVRFAYPEW